MNEWWRLFFSRSTQTVARELLGMRLIHHTARGTLAGTIVETEAYCGIQDAAAHSYMGRRTRRTEIMFHEAGRAYVYMIYGLHVCLNVVTAPPGQPEAVLIRALKPLAGIRQMQTNRGTKSMRQLTNGPGKLTQALDITMADYGKPLWKGDLQLLRGPRLAEDAVERGPRINIPYAGEARHYPWRFWIKNNRFVSR